MTGWHGFGCRAPDATVVSGRVKGFVANGEADGLAAVVIWAELWVDPQAPHSSAAEPSTTSQCVAFMFYACNARWASSLPVWKSVVDGQRAVVAVVAGAAPKKRRCRTARLAGRRTDQVAPAELETAH